MAVTSTASSKTLTSPFYPIIKQNTTDSNLIVLFTRKNFGFVIKEAQDFSLGHHTGIWYEENFQKKRLHLVFLKCVSFDRHQILGDCH